MKKMLMLASTASMIDQFNMNNIRLLMEQGYEVHVAANFEDGNTSSLQRISAFKNELDASGIPYYQIGFSRKISDMGSNLKAYRQVRTLMRKNRYDFIHCHSPIGGVCGRLAGHKTSTPVIYTAHGFHFFKGAPLRNWLLYYPIEKWLSRYTDCLITINREDYNNVIKRRFKAKRIELVHGIGIDLAKFKPRTAEEKRRIRMEYGYDSKDFILVCIGELNKTKHQDLSIRAVGLLKEKIPEIRLLLIGRGALLQEYKEQARANGVEGQVDFTGFRTDVENYLAMADMAVSTSRREGLPVNVMESMAAGLPLVVTDCRGNRDLVTDNQNGFVVGLDDAQQLAGRIETLYQSEALCMRFGTKSLTDIQEYSLENVLHAMKRIYFN